MRVLPDMMKQKCIFYVDNIRIAEIDGTIVGIAAIGDSSSHLELPSLDRKKSSEGLRDTCENYFSEIPEVLSTIENSAYLACLCVDSSMRGQRVGEILLKNVIHECRERNLSAITLDVLAENPVAIRLSQNYGFETISSRPGYSFGEEAPSCLQMMLDLSIVGQIDCFKTKHQS